MGESTSEVIYSIDRDSICSGWPIHREFSFQRNCVLHQYRHQFGLGVEELSKNSNRKLDMNI